MSDFVLRSLRDAIQIDPGGRGLATDPVDNLFTACAGDFEAACRSVATTAHPALAIFTGFCITHADPPCGETDGPLGALFLARALVPLGIRAAVFTDMHSASALEFGLSECGLAGRVPLRPIEETDSANTPDVRALNDRDLAMFQPTHLVAVERVGPITSRQQVVLRARVDQGVVAGVAVELSEDLRLRRVGRAAIHRACCGGSCRCRCRTECPHPCSGRAC